MVETLLSDTAAPEPSATPRGTTRSRWAESLQDYGVALAALLLVVIVATGNPAFLSPANINNMLSQWSPAGIMAIGMTLVILAGGFDLSISSGFAFCAVIAAIIGQQTSPILALLGSIAAGTVIGSINATLVSVFKINPFITTVGTGFVINGLSLVVTRNAAFIVSNPAFGILGAGRWHGIPYSGMLLIVLFPIAGLVLSRSVYGHMIYAVGGNAEASKLSGIRADLIVASTYIFLGAGVGLAGFISASQLNSAQANLDPRNLVRRFNYCNCRRHVAWWGGWIDLANCSWPRNHRDHNKWICAAGHQPILSRRHQGADHRRCPYSKFHAAENRREDLVLYS